MAAQRFVDALNEQIGRELGAAHAYLVSAFWYEDATFPQLAKLFHAQADEEREHALMMAKYLLDSGARPHIPAVGEMRAEFSDFVGPIAASLEQERKVTEQISSLAAIAREEGDYQSEQFVQWFLKEQVEEVDLFSSLLDVAERSRDRPNDLEDYIAREGVGVPEGGDPTAPPVAGAG